MGDTLIKMEKSIIALRGAAKGIAAAIEEESITSDEVYSLINTIADRQEAIIKGNTAGLSLVPKPPPPADISR